MNKNQIIAEIKSIIIDITGLQEKEILMEHNLVGELTLDDIDFVEFLMEIENKFNISIDDEKAARWKILQDVVLDVEKCVSKLK